MRAFAARWQALGLHTCAPADCARAQLRASKVLLVSSGCQLGCSSGTGLTSLQGCIHSGHSNSDAIPCAFAAQAESSYDIIGPHSVPPCCGSAIRSCGRSVASAAAAVSGRRRLQLRCAPPGLPFENVKLCRQDPSVRSDSALGCQPTKTPCTSVHSGNATRARARALARAAAVPHASPRRAATAGACHQACHPVRAPAPCCAGCP